MFSFLCLAFRDFGPGPHLCGGLNPGLIDLAGAHRYVAIAWYATQMRVLYDLCALPVFGGADLCDLSSRARPPPLPPGTSRFGEGGFSLFRHLCRGYPGSYPGTFGFGGSTGTNQVQTDSLSLAPSSASPIDVDQNHSADAHACQGMLATGFVCFTAQVRGTLSPLGLRQPSTGYCHLRDGRIFLLPPPARRLPIPLLYDPGGLMIPGES